MIQSVSGISIDPEGTKIIDDVIHLEETLNGYLLQMSIPDISVRYPMTTTRIRSLDVGEKRYGFTIQLNLSELFQLKSAHFFHSICINARAVTHQEFNAAGLDTTHELHGLFKLYHKVGHGLQNTINEKGELPLNAASVVTAIVFAVNTYTGEWASYHELPMHYGNPLFAPASSGAFVKTRYHYASITSPLRKSRDRFNLRQLIAFLSRQPRRSPLVSTAFTPNEGSDFQIGSLIFAAFAEEPTIALNNLSFEHIAMILFAPSGLKEGHLDRAHLQQQLVNQVLASKYTISSAILRVANRLCLLESYVYTKKHGRSYMANVTIYLKDGTRHAATATSKCEGRARGEAHNEVLEKMYSGILSS